MRSLGGNLAQIRSNVVKKQKNWHFNRGFHVLHEVYILKQEVVGIEIPEWKLKAKVARNTKLYILFSISLLIYFGIV